MMSRSSSSGRSRDLVPDIAPKKTEDLDLIDEKMGTGCKSLSMS
jgi:hypothetical protein